MTEDFDGSSAVADASNVLVVTPALDDAHDELCCDVLRAGETDPDRVVGVTIADSPESKHSTWRADVGTAPSYAFVSVNGASRSAAAQAGTAGKLELSTVERVDDVTPLDSFGMTIVEQIESGPETAVCFDSITDLLEYVDRDTAFKFLHVLVSRVQAEGARAHFHIDSAAHDEETIALFSTLFDVVVECNDGDCPRA
ncbi:DUF835 domain-containing protein [Halomicrobium urmianum]|uniref:DUF835 domain-containing protein n=1 Tax=Halomicrobium urmianum TaxID=1586233 RepID=UPI001CD9AD17|nr:DUF835 domain-containing protein [Halomicrobium urmianum]